MLRSFWKFLKPPIGDLSPKKISHNFDPEVDYQAMRQRADNDLARLFYSHRGNLVQKWHHYLEVYDRYLSRFRESDLKFLEIGVSQGGSLELWRKYFGSKATIVGIDTNPKCQRFGADGTFVRIGSQADSEFLSSLLREFGKFDVIIDDGSHMSGHQIFSFKHLFPTLRSGGVYVCEDLHTSYWDRYGGGYKRPESYIEFSKTLVDDINGWYARETNELEVNAYTKSIFSIAYFDSMTVVEKRTIDPPFRVRMGKKQI